MTPRRIGVDLRFTSRGHLGTGSYAERATLALARAVGDRARIIGFGTELPGEALGQAIDWRMVPIAPMRPGHPGDSQAAWDGAIAQADLDCFWAPTGVAPLYARCPCVVTIHDLFFLEEPRWYGEALLEQLRAEVPRSVRGAAAVVCISAFTRRQVLQHLAPPAERVHVVPQGLASWCATRPAADAITQVLTATGIEHPYVLVLSNHAPHKHTPFAIRAFAAWRTAHPRHPATLVIAGGGPAPNRPDDLGALVDQLGLADHVRILGRIPGQLLPPLMAGARAFLFPSLAEGWGLPPLEAMAMGTPALVSDRGALPEAVADAAIVLPVDDPTTWVEPLDTLLRRGPESTRIAAMQRRTQELLGMSGDGLADILLSVCASGQAVVTPATAGAGISGCTIVRNGVRLRYPFLESLASYAPLCDEIVICWDPTSDDDTRALVAEAQRRFPQVVLVESAWDLDNRRGGSELAHQTQIAFGHCTRPWTLYVQADEAVHEADHARLRDLVRDGSCDAIGFQRQSFLGTLDREIVAHRVAGLFRLFRTGSGRSVGDAMQVEVVGRLGPPDAARMFNYSRLGDAAEIATRTRNLHAFYHSDAEIAAMPTDADAGVADQAFVGSHPAPITARFGGARHASAASASTQPAVRISAQMLARERDGFGCAMLMAALESLRDSVDELVVVDNGLSEAAREAIMAAATWCPVQVIDARGETSFAALRNRGSAAVGPDMTHLLQVDTDMVFLPGSLARLRQAAADHPASTLLADEVHAMIRPDCVQSVHPRPALFRRGEALRWDGTVHEHAHAAEATSLAVADAAFLHLGYCRPQWQTMVKWLHYAWLQFRHLDHYRFEMVDGVCLPWFRGGRTPDTILDARLPHLHSWPGPMPPAVAGWLTAAGATADGWRDWVGGQVGGECWQRWCALQASAGSWEATLEAMLFDAHPELRPA